MGARIKGATENAKIDRLIAASSLAFERDTNSKFIPVTETRTYDIADAEGRCLYLDAHLISVSTLTDENGSREWTEGTHFELEPRHAPPYTQVQALLAGAYRWSGSTSDENAISIAGDWGYSADTESAGSLGAIVTDETDTTITVKDGSVIGVGDTLLIDSERLFVSEVADVDLAVNLSGNLAAQRTTTTVTLSGAPTDAVNVGEVIRINDERMKIRAINSTTVVIVDRAWDGTTLAAHTSGDDIYIERVFSVTRGEGGTTAVTHADDTVIARYTPPLDVVTVVTEEAIAGAIREAGGAAGDAVDTGATSQQFRGINLNRIRETAVGHRKFWRW